MVSAVVLVALGWSGSEAIWPVLYVLATLVPHYLLRYRQMSLLGAHITTFVVFSTLYILNNLAAGTPGFIFPATFWSVLVAAHWQLHSRLLGADGGWNSSLLDRLDQHAARTTGMHGALLRNRGLALHLAVYLLGAIEFAILNLLKIDVGPWLVWPVGCWLVVLAGHIGFTVLRGHPVLGVLLGSGLTGSLGLMLINRAYSDYPWAVFPIGVWLMTVAIGVGFGARGVSRLFRAHQLATIVVILVLLGLYVQGSANPWAVWPIWAATVLLGIHAGARWTSHAPWTGMWVLGGGAVVAGLAGIDLMTDGPAWFPYPLAVWLVLAVVFSALNIDLVSLVDDAGAESRRVRQVSEIETAVRD